MSKVTVDGKTYTLTTDADHTNRVMPVNSYQAANQGDSFDFEMVAKAVDESGNEYSVYWIFEATKGDEQELDGYDYSRPDRVEAA